MLYFLKRLLTRNNTTPHAVDSEDFPVTTILHIDSSILGGYSVSRALSAGIVDKLLTLHPGARVIRRDLVVDAALHLSDAHLAVLRGGEAASQAFSHDLAVGSAYIDDLFAADVIVIGVPMYNFSVPSQLKGWIDRVAVAGRTFKYTPNGPEALLPPGKKVFLASTRGGVYTGNSPEAAFEHQESYLRAAIGFIGLTDVTVIRAEGLNLGDESKAAAIAGAKAQIEALAA